MNQVDNEIMDSLSSFHQSHVLDKEEAKSDFSLEDLEQDILGQNVEESAQNKSSLRNDDVILSNLAHN